LLGSVWAIISFSAIRLFGAIFFKERIRFVLGTGRKRIAIIGSKKETNRVTKILKDSGINFDFVGRIPINEQEHDSELLGEIYQIEDIIKINKIDELVFCSTDISANDIIETMLSVKNASTDYKIAPPESASVIGSNSINTAGDLYVVDINSLNKGLNKRKKRMFDILSGATLLLVSPVLLFFIKNRIGFIRNCLFVIIGHYTWVGVSFDRHHNSAASELKPGVLSPSNRFKDKNLNAVLEERVNIMYAKDYKVINDFVILIKNVQLLGKQK
jgi:hypothetical protein